jgi:hypothetical protein
VITGPRIPAFTVPHHAYRIWLNTTLALCQVLKPTLTVSCTRVSGTQLLKHAVDCDFFQSRAEF